MPRLLILLLCLLLQSLPSLAQDTIWTKIQLWLFTKIAANDAVHLPIRPVQWNGAQWATFGAVVAGTGFISAFDRDLADLSQRLRTPESEKISKYGLEPWGRGLYTLPALGILYGVGALNKNERDSRAAFVAGEAFILGSGANFIIKHAAHRHRPWQDASPYHFEGPFKGFKYVSFASGHTQGAFAAATVLSGAYPEKKWLPYTLFGMATLTALSRMHDNKHWASDVAFGAALGVANGMYMLKRHGMR